ncbi:MAG: M48 family metallopeptidase, partial [Gemmatimonadota bacterium]|nr:M48 family metallopeptidase [Gemmatimonadota bacterium]
PLEDSELESYMAAGVASEVSSRYMVCPDDSINAQVRRLGAKVLNNWPTALRGYKYKFNVLESRTVNAFAAPGGQIFVLTGLLDAAESENEILGILAHEVTHVERRHGVRQFKSEKKWATIAWLAGFGTGIVLNKTRPNPGATFIIGNLLLEISSLALEIAFSGYSRKFENEADYYAIAFMNSVGDSQSYARIMRKLKYNSNVNGMVGLKSNVFDTHPDINQRVDYANNARVRVFPGGKVFIGYNKDGDRAAEVCFEMQCASRGDEPVPLERPEIGNFRREDFQRYKTVTMLKLFANLTAFPEIGKPCLVKEIKVTAGGRTHRLDNKEDTYLFPLRRVGVTFESNSGDLLEQIEGIELKLREVSFLGKLGKETKLRFVPEGEK